MCASRQKASMEYKNELNLFPKLNMLEYICQIIKVNICATQRIHQCIINTREETSGDQQQAKMQTMDFVPFVLFCKKARTSLLFPSFYYSFLLSMPRRWQSRASLPLTSFCLSRLLYQGKNFNWFSQGYFHALMAASNADWILQVTLHCIQWF